jgi:hypothetical protein
VIGATVGLLSAAAQLAPLFGSGYLLVRDMVFVPHLPLSGAVLGRDGVPRAVPSDLVVSLASHVVPGWIVQRVVLVGILVVAGWGAARLLPGDSRVGAAAAAAAYTWNPYVSERLLMGHWALLIGYAVMPHAAVAVMRLRRDGGSGSIAALVGWLGVAAIGGAAAQLLSALVAVPCALVGPAARRTATTVLTVGALVIFALPWLVPALLQPTTPPADHVGARSFAVRPDTPFGTLGSVLSLGGIWNAAAVPPGRDSLAVGLAALLVTAVAVGFLVATRQRLRALPGLVTGSVLGLALALWGWVPGARRALSWVVADVPGGGLLRDGQKFLAPLAVLLSLGIGVAAAELARRGRRVQVAVVTAAPVALLPGAAYGASGALTPVHWPAEWASTASAVDALPPGPVLDLPWSTYRVYPWDHDRPLLDPSSRWFDRRIVHDDTLRVGSLVTPGEDPMARRIAGIVTGGGPLTAALATRGYAGAVVDTTTPTGTQDVRRFPGARVVARHGRLVVIAVASSHRADVARAPLVPILAGDSAAASALVAAGLTISRRRRSTRL